MLPPVRLGCPDRRFDLGNTVTNATSGGGGQRHTQAHRGHARPQPRPRHRGKRGPGPCLGGLGAHVSPFRSQMCNRESNVPRASIRCVRVYARVCACVPVRARVPVRGVCAQASRGLCDSPASSGANGPRAHSRPRGFSWTNRMRQTRGHCTWEASGFLPPAVSPGNTPAITAEADGVSWRARGHMKWRKATPCPARAQPARGRRVSGPR